ncbi:MAG: hypothetical protein AABY18_03395 [Candidatus Thermoplasmatota archaeon]
MRRMAVLPVLFLLLAGCAEEPADLDADEADDDAQRQSVGGAGGRADNTTRIWEHNVVWTTDAAPASTEMQVPVNASNLVLSIWSTPTAPCGANVGESDNPLAPAAEFVSPTGTVMRFDLSANECRVQGASVRTLHGDQELGSETGTWKVSFAGRGVNLEQTLVVEGELVA